MDKVQIINTDILKMNLSNETYQPTAEEMRFIQEAYQLFQDDRNIKNQGLDILNGRTLQDIEDEADREYNIFFPETEEDGWRKNYRSLITQDKINDYWANIYQDWIYPEIVCVNKEQSLDRIMSRVARGLLEHAERNDGHPFSSGFQTFLRQGHQTLKKGTCHTFYNVLNGECSKEIAGNEEIFIPNYYQFDLQSQPHLIRLKDNVTRDEAEKVFGSLPNFKYVHAGRTENWSLGATPFFKNYNSGIVLNDRVQIIYLWKPVMESELSRGRKIQKYFNVLINGVLMFPIDNKMPFKHGLYPCSKRVADLYDANFYWGKPLYLRFKADKQAYDDFRSIILNKEVLNLLKPMVSMNGLHIDQDILRPGKITAVSESIDDLKVIPGISDAPDSSSFNIMQFLKQNMNESAPQQQTSGTKLTARQAEAQAENVRTLQSTIALFTAFDIEVGAYITLRNCFQFYPRRKVGKLVLSDQQLSNGRNGDLEILFAKIPDMTERQQLDISSEIYRQESDNTEQGNPDEMAIIDTSYANELDLYLMINANQIQRKSHSQEQAEALSKNELYANDQMINQEERVRILVRAMGDNEDTLVQQPQQPAEQPGQPGQPGSTNIPNTNAMQSARKLTNPLPQLQR